LKWEHYAWTEDKALAVCFINVKGSKTKELIRTASAMAFLRSLRKYGTNGAVGEAVGVRGEMVRQFLTLLTLPEQVQILLDEGKLGLEKGQLLRRLSLRRPQRAVVDAAKAMTGISAHDSRALVDYVLRHDGVAMDDAKRAVLESKTSVRDEYHVMAELSEDEYRQLVAMAKKRRMKVNDVVTSLVRRAIHKDARDG